MRTITTLILMAVLRSRLRNLHHRSQGRQGRSNQGTAGSGRAFHSSALEQDPASFPSFLPDPAQQRPLVRKGNKEGYRRHMVDLS